jgi:hypothetical protein
MTLTGSYISMFHSDNAIVVIVVLHYNALSGVLFPGFDASLHPYNRK